VLEVGTGFTKTAVTTDDAKPIPDVRSRPPRIFARAILAAGPRVFGPGREVGVRTNDSLRSSAGVAERRAGHQPDRRTLSAMRTRA
jgi:hypothetical protein